MHIDHGECLPLFIFDVGYSIDLSLVERRIAAATQRENVLRKHRAPAYVAYDSPPLIVRQPAEPIRIGRFATTAVATLVIYDFGAVCVSYSIKLSGPLGDLLDLSAALYAESTLKADSRRRVAALVESIAFAITRPRITAFAEDYVIYQIDRWTAEQSLDDLIFAYAQPLAQILRGESDELAPQQVQEALANRVSFGLQDAAIIDWSAAILFDSDSADVRAVLEFANVELLEMRHLDDQLDDALEESARLLARRRWHLPFTGRVRRDLRRLSGHQMDAALLFEQVNNTLKLIGDQYLARVYRVAAQRFHLSDWDTSILRKIQTLESVYEKLTDHHVQWRMEVLEWIIIVLIAISIVLPFLPGAGKG